MDKWELQPLVAIGNIKFGMKREQVHQLFDKKYAAFKKSTLSKNTTDDYGKFHVFYTENNEVEAVEIFEGIEVLLNGKKIYPVKANEIEALTGCVKDEDGYMCVEKSIGFYAPDEKVESILVGEQGYYE